MKILSYWLMVGGMVLAVGGVVGVFNFDQPSDPFSSAWWMIVGGWCLALIGMGIDIMHLFKLTECGPAYLFETEANRAERVEGEITRM